MSECGLPTDPDEPSFLNLACIALGTVERLNFPSVAPLPEGKGGSGIRGQAAGFSLPGAVHSAPFMNESFGVCARWFV